MLLTETVMIKWNEKTRNHYESRGYVFTKTGDKFEIKIEDLTKSSRKEILVKCDCEDCKEPYLKPMMWATYLKVVKEDGKYYCNKCARKLFIGETIRKTKLLNGKSFEQWCIENDKQDILDRWDYDLNSCKPSQIGYNTNKKYYFKCPKGLHKSEQKDVANFVNGQEGVMNCKGCNSFGEYLLNTYGESALDLYWDYENNTVNPFEIAKTANSPKVWIKCQNKEKEYHGSYEIRCSMFVVGHRCYYCNKNSGKVHPLDSLGKLLEDKGLLYLWSDKNDKSPYEYAPMTKQYAWFKCPEGIHNDEFRNIQNANECEFRCTECQYSKGETKISEYLANIGFLKLDKYSYETNKIFGKVYIPQKEFDDLIGLGDGKLSYDFYLPKYNLLIEYQGEQHESFSKVFHKSKKDFEKQQEHDRRKKEYANDHNIKLLEIWYWDYDNIEKILDEELRAF